MQRKTMIVSLIVTLLVTLLVTLIVAVIVERKIGLYSGVKNTAEAHGLSGHM